MTWPPISTEQMEGQIFRETDTGLFWEYRSGRWVQICGHPMGSEGDVRWCRLEPEHDERHSDGGEHG